MNPINCPECGVSFRPKHHLTTFCCPEHQKRFHDTMAIRGRVIMPLLLVMRTDKNGRTESNAYARRQAWALLDRWNAEDRAAGRKSSIVVDHKRKKGWAAADLGVRHNGSPSA